MDEVLEAPAVAAPPEYTSTLSLGAQIDELFDLREKKRAAEAAVDEIKDQIDLREAYILGVLESQGLQGSKGLKASVGIQESVVPQVIDWDTFYAFVRRNNAFELLERRPATAAFREHAERRRDKTVPGVMPYTKRKLSLRVNT